jgi:signal transduction histidine kinase
MGARHHLRRRILGGFVLFGLTIVAFSIGTFVKAYYDGQDSLQEALIRGEIARVQQALRTGESGRLPGDGPFFAYRSRESMSALHREITSGLGQGLHEIDRETGPAAARDLAVWVGSAEGTGEPLWIIFDTPDVETIPRIARDYAELALAYGLALILFGGWLAGTISRRISEPLEHFAEEIQAQAPGEWRGDFSKRYGSGEIGALAGALDTTIRRNRDLLERERVFMQNASHELRTPITVIGSAAEVLESMPELKAGQAHRLVNRIGRAARDMTALTEAFLWLGREADPESPAMSCVGGDAAKAALRHTLPLLDGKPVDVKIIDRRPTRVACRPQLLEIALTNLLRNAFQHVTSGQVEVILDGDAIEIADTGSGLPDMDEAGLLRRGGRGAGSEGFGMGLAIVNQICERMGWRLTLENRPSGGCRARLHGLRAPQSA